MDVNIYTAVGNKSPKASDKVYGYVLECLIGGEPVTKEAFGRMNGTYHALSIYAVIEALGRVRKADHIKVYVEDRYVSGMAQNVPAWSEKDYKTSKGEPVANAALWQELYCYMCKYDIEICDGDNQYSRWLHDQMERGGIE